MIVGRAVLLVYSIFQNKKPRKRTEKIVAFFDDTGKFFPLSVIAKFENKQEKKEKKIKTN